MKSNTLPSFWMHERGQVLFFALLSVDDPYQGKKQDLTPFTPLNLKT